MTVTVAGRWRMAVSEGNCPRQIFGGVNIAQLVRIAINWLRSQSSKQCSQGHIRRILKLCELIPQHLLIPAAA